MRLTWIHFFSWIWAALCPCNTIVQPPMILRQDHMKVIERNDKVQELNPMISCVETIARGWFMNKERVPLLIPNFVNTPGLSKAFITGLQNEVVTFSVTEDFTNSEQYRESNSAVILIRNSTDINLLNDLNELCASRCRYVVCLLNLFNDEKSLLTEVDEVVKLMWKMWIVNLVIIASTSGKFIIAGSYSFKSNAYRTPKKPEILGECSTLSTKPNKYIFHKLLLNNCRVNVSVFSCLPYAEIVEEDGHEVIIGIEGNLFETVAKSLNVSLNRLNVSTDSNDSMYKVLLSSLYNPHESDVAFCGLYCNISEGIEYSVTFDRQEIVWMVPSISALSLLGLVTPFQNNVWFAVIGLLLFTVLIKVFLFRKLSFLGVLALILGIALPQQPKSLSNRIQFVSWIFFGYVITQSYLASLAGQLMNTNYETIETMDELVRSGISFGGTDRHRDLFKDDENYVGRKIYQKYQTLSTEEYDVVMKAMLAGKNNSIALIDEIEISAVQSQISPYHPHKLAETLASYPVSIAVWKGLPYLDQINDKVAHLREAGMVKYWSEKYSDRSSSIPENTVSTELDMLHLSPSFLLLLLGHAVSIIVFFIEIGVYVRKNHVRLNVRNRNKITFG